MKRLWLPLLLLLVAHTASAQVTLAWDPPTVPVTGYTLRASGQVCAQVDGLTFHAVCQVPIGMLHPIFTVTASNGPLTSVPSEPVVQGGCQPGGDPLGVSIRQFDAQGTAGLPLNVWLATSAPVVQLRIQLNPPGGGPQFESVIDAPMGVQVDQAKALISAGVGTWHLYAQVSDLTGCVARTGLVRTVTVQ